MSIFLIIPLIYLVIGTFLARNDYARRLAVHGSRDFSAEIDAKRGEMNSLRHSSNCWRGPTYRSRDHDCDCSHRVRWKNLRNEIVELESGHVKVTGPYPMLFAWPLLGFHGFLTGGTAKMKALSNDEYVKQLERLNEIPSLEG